MTEGGRAEALIAQLREHDQAVHQLASRIIPPPLLPNDLTLRQLQVLVVIRAQPGVTGQELAGHLQVSTPTVSGLVDRLVGKGLLSRHTDPQDRRRVLLTPTDRALETLAEMESLRSRISREALLRLTVPELEMLVTVSGRLREIAEEMAQEHEAGVGSQAGAGDSAGSARLGEGG